MKVNQIIYVFLLGIWLLSGCATKAGDEEQARQALVAFFDHLSKEVYPEAVKLYGGSYEMLFSWNPEVNPDDLATLWQNGCKVNGLQCLTLRTITFNELTAKGEYIFTVQFNNPDGSLFERGACCGEVPATPPTFQFEYRVVRGGDGIFRVLDMPVYVP